MDESLLRQQMKVRHGAYLPHWTRQGATYHVVFRLADSLPAHVVAQFRAEREALRTDAIRAGKTAADVAERLRVLFSERMESVLDQGQGACWLALEPLALGVSEALRHFDGVRYSLHAWCVMPNHVHVVVQPKPGHELPAILKSWKGFTALQANRHLGREGDFWQPEYYDHLIRDGSEMAATIRYIQNNPIKAKLTNWRWFWPDVARVSDP
ncbi:MAG: transposase [Opitutaceae bacterium]|nr:transposase [Opitutaceae bacterium]